MNQSHIIHDFLGEPKENEQEILNQYMRMYIESEKCFNLMPQTGTLPKHSRLTTQIIAKQLRIDKVLEYRRLKDLIRIQILLQWEPAIIILRGNNRVKNVKEAIEYLFEHDRLGLNRIVAGSYEIMPTWIPKRHQENRAKVIKHLTTGGRHNSSGNPQEELLESLNYNPNQNCNTITLIRRRHLKKENELSQSIAKLFSHGIMEGNIYERRRINGSQKFDPWTGGFKRRAFKVFNWNPVFTEDIKIKTKESTSQDNNNEDEKVTRRIDYSLEFRLMNRNEREIEFQKASKELKRWDDLLGLLRDILMDSNLYPVRGVHHDAWRIIRGMTFEGNLVIADDIGVVLRGLDHEYLG